MIKQLLKKTNKSFLKLVLTILGLTAISASAQMSGTVTIDAAGTASSTVFKDWYSFWRSLQGLSRTDGGATLTAGVSGAVTVNVNTDLTESNAIQFPQITGMSSTNTITINGNGKAFIYSGSYEAVSFSGGDYFRIKNLIIRHTNSSTSSSGIRFSGGSDYNLIDKCTIEFTAMVSGSTGGSSYVNWTYSQGSLTSATSTSTGSSDTVRNCTMQTTGSNAAGPAIAIAINGNTSNYSSTPQNNTVTGNTIKNFYYMGIYNYYTNGNQVTNNDISRSASGGSSMYSYPYFTYSYMSYSSNRPTVIDGNNFHDLPYTGVSASSSSLYYFYNYIYYNYGNSTNYFSFSGNTFKNIMCYYYCYGVYGYYNYQANFNSNTFDNVQTYSSGYSTYIFRIYYGQDVNLIGNKVQNCSFGYYAYVFYLYNNTNSIQTYMSFEDNVVQNNYSGYYFYNAQIYYYGSWKVNRNRIIGNTTNPSQGYFYGLYLYYLYNVQCNSNVIADNMGYYGTYNMYTYAFNSGYPTFEMRQNTIRAVASNYSYHYNYGLLSQFYYSTDTRVAGNIVDLENSYYTYGCWLYTSSASNLTEVDNNTFWLPNNQYLNFQYYNLQTQSFAGWAGSGPGPGENYHYPEYFNLSGQDYHAKEYSTQNTALTKPSNPKDAVSAARNAGFSDRGGLELFMDIKAEGSNFSVPSSVCQGYSTTGATKIYVRSLYQYDTAYKIKVAYSVNGGPKTKATTTRNLFYNNLDTAVFNVPLTLNTVGLNTIYIFVDNGDDNRSNDTLKFTTTVKPAPGGEKIAFGTKTTKAVYQYGKPNDVTIVNEHVYYNHTSPQTTFVSYTNAQYGSKWTATSWTTTAKGRTLTSAEATATYTPPSGSTDGEVDFVAKDASLEDTMCTVFLKITDLSNGCDTLIKRNVLVYPSITPKFGYPTKICDGDAVGFVQQSTVKSGSIAFWWDFGTGKVADQTDAPEPVFQFPGPGTYKVKMRASTLPYGFTFYDSASIVVNSIPTVKFTKVNACEGNAVKFTNLTTPSSASSSWDFGDGGNSVATNPSHTYAAGAYTATLTASLNGCSASSSQRVYEFDKPKANWKLVTGTCDNDAFDFESLSTIKNGLVGNYWNFNDGNVSTEDNPEHMFSAPGDKTIKLVATSEFGCKDSMSKVITVKESPKTAFTSTSACSITPTTFTNLTPPVSLTSANYAWDFGDGTTSGAMSPTHAWTNLGPKTVMLTVTLDNGCKASVSKDLTVGVQPTAKFVAQNVCSGQPVVFENNTTWAQGDITYTWNFGDATTSTNSDPLHNYGNVTKTTTYFVTLYADIAGGCRDSITKSVTVNEGPKTCDFKYDPDYAFGFHGMKFNPLDAGGNGGAQTGVTYTWVIKNGGTLNGGTPQYDFQEDGEYEVTMRARVDATGCECTVTKKVVMNRTSVKDLQEVGMALYPNPSSGSFNIALTETFGKDIKVELVSMTGAVVKTISGSNTGLMTINASELANGVYMVRVSSNDKVVVRNIQIQK